MLRNLLRQFDQCRRRHASSLGRWAYGLIGRDRVLCDQRLPHDQIHRIMVVRNNKRIGNMYFLLPFLNQLRATYPHADIDLMVIAQSQARIFEHMPLNRRWVSHFSFSSVFRFLQTMRKCRSQPYDLLLMPHPSSTDILIGGFIRARNKVSFARDRVTPVYPHSVEQTHAHPHAAKTPLALIDTDTTDANAVNHLMAFNEHEREAAHEEVMSISGSATYCIAYFRGARGKKIIADNDWRAIREMFNLASAAPIVWIEILSPDVTEPLTADTPTWQSGDFRRLGAFLAACDLFICGDTGPLHLADAAGARCLGLFTATRPEHYGCMGTDCINVTDLSQIKAGDILHALQTPSIAQDVRS
jgi:ADP-heptose:LPS heptosyltransferase